MNRIYLSLGSNLGGRERNLRRALDALEEQGIHVVARSSLYETEPQDVPDQPWFLNLAVAAETSYLPRDVLDVLHRIEREAGRVRTAETVPKGPRVLDIDILLFGEMVVNTPELTIPHPRVLERRFVLEPLIEIAPDLRDPVSRKPLRDSLVAVRGQQVRRVRPGSG